MSPANMEHIPGLDAWITRDPRENQPDCRCPEWMEDECCGGCDGEAGDCGCDPDKYWGLIAEAHHPYCPVCIAAKAHRKSSGCFCKELYKAEAEGKIKTEQECQRCHQFATDCRCPEEKRQWV